MKIVLKAIVMLFLIIASSALETSTSIQHHKRNHAQNKIQNKRTHIQDMSKRYMSKTQDKRNNIKQFFIGFFTGSLKRLLHLNHHSQIDTIVGQIITDCLPVVFDGYDRKIKEYKDAKKDDNLSHIEALDEIYHDVRDKHRIIEVCQKQESLRVDENARFSWTNTLFNWISGIWKNNTEYKDHLSQFQREIQGIQLKVNSETAGAKILFSSKAKELVTIKKPTHPQIEAIKFLTKANRAMDSVLGIKAFQDDVCQVLDNVIDVPFIVRLMAFSRGALDGLKCAASKIEITVSGFVAIVARIAGNLAAGSAALPMLVLIKTIQFLWANFDKFYSIANYFSENEHTEQSNDQLLRDIGDVSGSFIINLLQKKRHFKRRLFKK